MRPILLLTLASLAGAQSFEVRLLDAQGALGLDAPAQVVRGGTAVGLGIPLAGGDPQPVLWSAAGTQLLPLVPGDEAGHASAVSPDGTVAGTSSDVVQQGNLTFIYESAVIWPPNGAAIELEGLVTGGATLELFQALGVDAAGAVLGWGRDAAAARGRGWILENGFLTDLGALPGAGSVEPRAWNASRTVVGEADAAGNDHAFLWQDGALIDLHVVSGVPGFVSEANGVNDAGTIVGAFDPTADGLQWESACAWLPDLTLVPLPTLGGNQSAARGVNASGDAVGFSLDATGDLRATLWRDGSVFDLNDRIPTGTGWILRVANSIADDGRIVGEGFLNGALRAYVLEPVCESCASFCISTPNSTGAAAVIASEGWESVSAGFLTLTAEPVPANQPGLFFFGPEQVQVPFGNGFLCVGPGNLALFRLPAVQADAAGRLVHPIDFGKAPASVHLAAGTTWQFQGWFRDPAGGGAGFDSSDGLSVTFVQ